MNTAEIDLSLKQISPYLNERIQAVFFLKKTLILQIYLGQQAAETLKQKAGLMYIFFCASTKTNAIFTTRSIPSQLKSESKPLYLFAKSHLTGARFSEISRRHKLGRVVEAKFVNYNEHGLAYQLKLCQNLVPLAINIEISTPDKSLSLNKPKDLPEFKQQKDFSKDVGNEALEKTLEKIKQNCLQEILKSKKKTLKIPSKAKTITKKKNLLQRLKQDLKTKKSLSYQDFALLLGEDSKKAELLYPNYFEAEKGIYDLQKKYFDLHKKNTRKIQRLQDRMQEIEKEIIDLNVLSEKDWAQTHQQKSSASGLKLQKAHKASKKVSARKLELGPNLLAYMGKSAKDNVQLLRQAKAWHFWLHIKDQPSAYVIVHCLKSKSLSFEEVSQIARWFVASSKSLAKSFRKNDKLSLLVTQCRYVHPIKGDKLGRVNYTHEQVFTIQI